MRKYLIIKSDSQCFELEGVQKLVSFVVVKISPKSRFSL